MSQRMKYMQELGQPCVIFHEDYSTTIVLNKGESIFTLHRVHHFPVRRIGSQPPLSVSGCRPVDSSGEMIWWQKARYHFLVRWVPLRAPKNLSCSFLVQF